MIVVEQVNKIHSCSSCGYGFYNNEVDGGTYFPKGYEDISFSVGLFGATICVDSNGGECDPNIFNKEYVFCPECNAEIPSGKEVLWNTQPLIFSFC